MGVFKVEYFVEFVGMTDPSSKRKITWRWMNAEDASGSTGKEPSELVFTWSVYSGKRRFELNGYEQLFTIDRSGVVDEKLQMQNGAELRIVATKTAPENSASFFRLYELLIDGRSFFTFPEAAHARGRDLTYIPCAYGGKATSILQILYPGENFDGSDSANEVPQATSPRRRTAVSTHVDIPNQPIQSVPMHTTPAPEVDLLDFSEPAAAPAQLTLAPLPVAAPPAFEGYQKTPPEVLHCHTPTMDNPVGMMVPAATNVQQSFNGGVSVLGDPESPIKEQNFFSPTSNPFASAQITGAPKPLQDNDLADLFSAPTQVVSPNDARDDNILGEQSAVPTAAPGKMLFDPFA